MAPSTTEDGAAPLPPAFPPADLLPATRFLGRVLIPDEEDDGGDLVAATAGKDDDSSSSSDNRATTPTTATQQHILCVATTPVPQYFWLQRKIRTTPHGGAVRVGFVLQQEPNAADKDNKIDQTASSSSFWKVAIVGDSQQELATVSAAAAAAASLGKRAVDEALPPKQVQMVAIRVEPRARVFAASSNDTDHSSLANELAALQWVQQQQQSGTDTTSTTTTTTQEQEFVQGPSVLLAGDAEHVYTIAPYDYYHTGSSSLLEYCCVRGGTLSEDTARGLFRQIVKVHTGIL